MMKKALRAAVLVVATALAGCSGQAAGTARVASLSGQPEGGFRMRSSQNGVYRIHELQARDEGDGLLVSGHIGPAARLAEGPSGHVDVDVRSPDGSVMSRASGALEPVSVSPRVFVERRFRVLVPGKPPAGSEVEVTYHAGEAFCHAEQ